MDIVFEGINGCGKSTVIDELARRLKEGGRPASIVSRAKSETSKRIREANIVREEFLCDYILESALVLCERRCDLATRRSIPLEIGLFERGIPSILAFGASRALERSQLLALVELLLPGFPTDNWVLIDVDAVTSAQRLRQQSRHRFEEYSTSWYDELRQNYLEIARQDANNVLVVDGSLRVDQIVDQVHQEFF